MVSVRVCAGAAGFAFALTLAGLGTAAIASADSSRADSSKADSTRADSARRDPAAASKGPAARQAKAAKRSAQAVAPAPTSNSNAPSITIHNQSTTDSIWVYNLTDTGNYSIPATPWQPEQPAPPPDWVGPVEITHGSSAPITLAAFNAPTGSPGNRIYIVEGSPFTLPVTPTSGIDPFYPGSAPAGDSFQNYSFLEYNLDPATDQYTIDVSYIDEWSLPIQTQFTLNGADWTGAVNGKIYGFKDFDTVASQLNAAGGPYGNLVWSGATPWGPQPPSTVSRIVGPDKVWTAQSGQPQSNFNMNNVGWVPDSYSQFVQYPLPYNGTQLAGTQTNFDFWRYRVAAPGSTPYPIALRTAAILDGFTTADANGVYGFFTYPNDEAAGQFTNIPTAVSMDIYVNSTSDGVSDSVIPGGSWTYTSSAEQTGPWRQLRKNRPTLSGSASTDTFILDTAFDNARVAPVLDFTSPGGDIAVIDRLPLGATSTAIDFVDRAWFLGCGPSSTSSQFVYERSTGTLYYDRDPQSPGYTAILARFRGMTDPADSLFVL